MPHKLSPSNLFGEKYKSRYLKILRSLTFLPNITEIFPNIWESWHLQSVLKKSSFRVDTTKRRELTFLHAARPTNPTLIPAKYNQKISEGMEVAEHTSFCLSTSTGMKGKVKGIYF